VVKKRLGEGRSKRALDILAFHLPTLYVAFAIQSRSIPEKPVLGMTCRSKQEAKKTKKEKKIQEVKFFCAPRREGFVASFKSVNYSLETSV